LENIHLEYSKWDGRITLRCIFGRQINKVRRWMEVAQDHVQWRALY